MANKRPRPDESDEEEKEGYPEEMFLDLDDEEREDYQCNICLQVVRQPVYCENTHFFCSSCLKRWTDWQNLSLIDSRSEKTCPVCQTIGSFLDDKETVAIIDQKKVICLEEKCEWSGELASYDDHIRSNHRQRGPSPRRLRSSDSKTARVTYYYH